MIKNKKNNIKDKNKYTKGGTNKKNIVRSRGVGSNIQRNSNAQKKSKEKRKKKEKKKKLKKEMELLQLFKIEHVTLPLSSLAPEIQSSISKTATGKELFKILRKNDIKNNIYRWFLYEPDGFIYPNIDHSLSAKGVNCKTLSLAASQKKHCTKLSRSILPTGINATDCGPRTLCYGFSGNTIMSQCSQAMLDSQHGKGITLSKFFEIARNNVDIALIEVDNLILFLKSLNTLCSRHGIESILFPMFIRFTPCNGGEPPSEVTSDTTTSTEPMDFISDPVVEPPSNPPDPHPSNDVPVDPYMIGGAPGRKPCWGHFCLIGVCFNNIAVVDTQQMDIHDDIGYFIGEEDVKKWLNGGAYKVNSKYYCGKDCVDKNTHSVPDCNTIGREKCENPLIIIPLAATGSKKMKKPKHKTIHNKKKKDKKKKKTISHVHK